MSHRIASTTFAIAVKHHIDLSKMAQCQRYICLTFGNQSVSRVSRACKRQARFSRYLESKCRTLNRSAQSSVC